MKHARIINNVAVDVVDGDPAERFHPSVAAEFIEVPEDVVHGSILDPETSTWSPPAAPTPEPKPAPAPETGNLQPTPPEFMATAFTFQERIAIRSARASDPAVDDFMTLIEDPRLTYVDLTLPGTRDAINYLASADVGLLTQERADQVLAGLPAPVPEMPA